jgi:hypothetical protein
MVFISYKRAIHVNQYDSNKSRSRSPILSISQAEKTTTPVQMRHLLPCAVWYEDIPFPNICMSLDWIGGCKDSRYSFDRKMVSQSITPSTLIRSDRMKRVSSCDHIKTTRHDARTSVLPDHPITPPSVCLGGEWGDLSKTIRAWHALKRSLTTHGKMKRKEDHGRASFDGTVSTGITSSRVITENSERYIKSHSINVSPLSNPPFLSSRPSLNRTT